MLFLNVGLDWADGDDVRGLELRARVFSVDGPNCVDLYHSYHHRNRCSSWEHFADVKFRVQAPFSEESITE